MRKKIYIYLNYTCLLKSDCLFNINYMCLMWISLIFVQGSLIFLCFSIYGSKSEWILLMLILDNDFPYESVISTERCFPVVGTLRSWLRVFVFPCSLFVFLVFFNPFYLKFNKIVTPFRYITINLHTIFLSGNIPIWSYPLISPLYNIMFIFC